MGDVVRDAGNRVTSSLPERVSTSATSEYGAHAPTTFGRRFLEAVPKMLPAPQSIVLRRIQKRGAETTQCSSNRMPRFMASAKSTP